MASIAVFVWLAFAGALFEARRVQSKQEIFGLDSLMNHTQNAFETVRGHAQSGFEAVQGHAQSGFEAVTSRAQTGWETVANTSQASLEAVSTQTQTVADSFNTVANHTQGAVQDATQMTREAVSRVQDATQMTREAVARVSDSLTCDTKQMDYAAKTLQGMCEDTAKNYDCIAGVFSVPRAGLMKSPKKDWVQCLEHPPMLTYGEPTCEKDVSDDKTTYVLACRLCLAHTQLCYHWAAWALGLFVLLMCCCCCCIGVCLSASA